MTADAKTALDIFRELIITQLSDSSAKDRTAWAEKIISENWPLMEFSNLLFLERRLALAFSWLISDIGLCNQTHLFAVLPDLFLLRKSITSFNFEQSFATYWLIAGVPEEHKGEAINLLFEWLQSQNVNSTTKSRAMDTLFNLSKTYPSLSNELILHLENIQNSYSDAFRKRTRKLLSSLKQSNEPYEST